MISRYALIYSTDYDTCMGVRMGLTSRLLMTCLHEAFQITVKSIVE